MSSTSRWPHTVYALLLVIVVMAMSLLGPASAEAGNDPRDLERDFHALINVERAKRDLGALQVSSDVVSVARRHSDRMARSWDLHHNPTFSTEITGWQRVAENVGYGPRVEAIHDALMNSEGHRRNILDDRITQVGIGVVVRDGRVWVTQNFRRPTGTVSPASPSTRTFGDVASTNVHARAIESVAARGIVVPCGTGRYCPTSAVSRGDFATMLTRALTLPAASGDAPGFQDVTGEQALAADALAAAGLTSGCGEGRFCPSERLSRAQLATFFARALELEPVPTTFTDVGRTHHGSIGALQRAGIINGCTSTSYCPGEQVTRAQTASMIARHLG